MLFRRTHEQMDAVLSPKITGTWNLHLLTKDDSMDFLCCARRLLHLPGERVKGTTRLLTGLWIPSPPTEPA